MELKNKLNKMMIYINKYKYIVLILVIGLIFITMPNSDNGKKEEEVTIIKEQNDKSIEEKLTDMLRKIDGAGRVEVMLTIAQGEEIIYQTNDDLSDGSDTSGKHTDTVTVTDADKNQVGLIRQVNPPGFLGALVICQGADNPSVKLAITEAVAKTTGLGANCISVLKMK